MFVLLRIRVCSYEVLRTNYLVYEYLASLCTAVQRTEYSYDVHVRHVVPFLSVPSCLDERLAFFVSEAPAIPLVYVAMPTCRIPV